MLLWIASQLVLSAAASALAARLLARSPRAERLAAAALIALAWPIAIIAVLSACASITKGAVLGMTAATALAVAAVAGAEARRAAYADATRAARELARAVRTSSALPAAVGVAAFCAAGCAGALLPFWTWDSLGYHMPVVWDALAQHRLREVPTHGWYINVYPRAGEMYFVWCRALLGHDRYLDLAQAPFALGACVGSAALAQRAGALPARALGYAALYLAIPVVALQIPTGYVDLIYAFLLIASVLFVSAPLDRAHLALFAVSAGLLLACKPTAPPMVTLLAAIWVVRALRKRRLALAALAPLVIAAFGSTYLRNLWRYGNPLWPVTVALGPVHLPGLDPIGPMLVRGLPESLNRGWLYRVAISLVADPPAYIYDMRYGGFWPLVPFALLPLAALALLHPKTRRAAAAPAFLCICSVASPMAQWLRFSLAFPAGLLALAAARVELLPRWPRRLVDLALAALAVLGLTRAWPAFTGNGPSLWAVARGAEFPGMDGQERAFSELKARLAPGETFAYDRTFATPGRLYREDGQTRVAYLDPEAVPPAELDSWLTHERVRLLAIADHGPLRDHVVSRPQRYRPVLSCPLDPCHIYQVIGARDGGSAKWLTPATEVFVVAPHPDDELLIAGGVLARAQRAGQRPHVVLMTNGDYDCIHDGARRQAESVAAMKILGLDEDQIIFLGYPDGYLAKLGAETPLSSVKRLENGRCEPRATTYARRGRKRRDYHREHFGEPGVYTAESAVSDLAALLAELRPKHVYVTHPIDTHPDHAATYTLLRRAIDRQPEAPVVHRAIVHIGGCWPHAKPGEPCPDVVLAPNEPLPALPAPLTPYRAEEQVPVPEDMRGTSAATNTKARALLAYESQLGRLGLGSYLTGFVRASEAFYPETLRLDPNARFYPSSAASGTVRVRSGWLELAQGSRREVEQQPPLAATWVVSSLAARPHLELLRTSTSSSYELTIDDSPELSLLRRGPEPRSLRTWPLAHDLRGPLELELRVEPRQRGQVNELSVAVNGELIGVAIDAEPLVRGDEVVISGHGAAKLALRALPANP